MQALFQKVKKVLLLEKEKGFQNTAVSGGLENFINYINIETLENNIPTEIRSYMIEFFKNYSNFSQNERESSIINMIAWLSQEDHADTSKRMVEPVPAQKIRAAKNSPLQCSQDPALYADIRSIKGIGDRNYRHFQKLGINNIYNLLRYYPRRYQDYSHLKTINSINYGEEITIAGIISGPVKTRKSKKGKLTISEAILSDSTGSIKITWFNSPFISRQLIDGISIVVSGKVDIYQGRYTLNNPVWELMEKEQIHTNRIVPIYPATSGITQRQIRNIINKNLSFWSDRISEYLPEQLIENESLLGISEALSQIHFPESTQKLNEAQKRFSFEEVFFLQIGVLLQMNKWKSKNARTFSLPDELINKRINILPYTLTSAQVKAIEDIESDLSSGKPMNRLIQGDVGSGKTVVSKFAVETIIDNGSQAVIMAPTSILAEQHFKTFSELLLESKAVKKDEIALLLGQTSSKKREKILEGLRAGSIKCIIGTHALLEESVQFKDLQLAIIDEQHRFGVNQRNRLSAKGENIHLLIMSATPIPRSLALTIYGDLDVTTIDELPPGRKIVTTQLFRTGERKKVYAKITNQLKNGFQAFIVYPKVDSEDEDEPFKSAIKEQKRLQKEIFSNFKVGLIHGRMASTEKESVMRAFRDQLFDVLVSTTVIEVGVDIPNATVVLIESANYFGLAQLHQIRGRVGRNSEDSFCFLIPENDNALENERLVAMTKIHDGFKLAEIDLDFRGPGEFLGTRQSGFAGLKFAKLTDSKLIEATRKQAQFIINNDPHLNAAQNRLIKEELFNYWPEMKDLSLQ